MKLFINRLKIRIVKIERAWIRARLRWHINKQYRTLRKTSSKYSLELRSHESYSPTEFVEKLVSIAERHNIAFGNRELIFPVNPVVDEFLRYKFNRRLLLHRNIVSIRESGGFVWIISRNGQVYGFSTTTDERICDYMLLDAQPLDMPRWWARFRIKCIELLP